MATWCPNDKQQFETQMGQITPYTAVGKYIIKTLRSDTSIKDIFEIGTWNGFGSTRCILLGLYGKDYNSFTSLECNADKVAVAKENLKHLLTEKDRLLHGSVLSKHDPAINNHYYLYTVFPEVRDNPEYNRWHFGDTGNILTCPIIPVPDSIDFLLLDGGEFTSYFEFFKLFPVCRKYIALDDVDVAKCSKIRSFLKSTGNWEEIQYIPERNGFSLFKKIEHPVISPISLKDIRMCIVGACRNVGDTLPTVLRKLENMEPWWKECKIIVYENDSDDTTTSQLQTWIQNGPNRLLVREHHLDSRYQKRTERLAYIRNTLMSLVPKEYDYCLMIDLDNVFTNPLSKEAFESCFTIPLNWDVVTGNSPYYYDIWALKVKELCESDCIGKAEHDRIIYQGYYSKESIDEGCIGQIGRIMTTMSDPMYVENAFDVGAIYKVSSIKSCCRFHGLKDGKEICEHRAFQDCLKSHGAKIVFNTKFYL